MKYLSFVFAFIAALLLNGCSSEPTIETRYYLLNQQMPDQIKRQSIGVSSAGKIVELTVREFPEYLNQPQLVMQLADHQ
ncbi:MAG: putative lipoprotein YmbA, partial [Phenylobacterium sp.]